MTDRVPVDPDLLLESHERIEAYPRHYPTSIHCGRPQPAGTRTEHKRTSTRQENRKEEKSPRSRSKEESASYDGRPGRPGPSLNTSADVQHGGRRVEQERDGVGEGQAENTTPSTQNTADRLTAWQDSPTSQTQGPGRREARGEGRHGGEKRIHPKGRVIPGRTSRTKNPRPDKTPRHARVVDDPAETPEAAPAKKSYLPSSGCTTNGSAAESEQGTATATSTLIDEILADENVSEALKTLRSRGEKAPGVDGQPTESLKNLLTSPEWPRTLQKIREGRYTPSPIRPCEIPKPDGGKRLLGIPTAKDRLIQTMVLNVLDPILDPDFSDFSYGFRKGRSAHDALQKLRQHILEGYRWTVKMDLSKFFDRVDHDILMARVARKIQDKATLRLIRAYLQAGVLREGRVEKRMEGTPQGGPLSPLLANILLDGLDVELERRGLPFVRYADDFVILVKSERAGVRVMESVKGFLEKSLGLVVNAEKSGVVRPWERAFLGYELTDESSPRFKVSERNRRRFEERVEELEKGEDPPTEIAEFIVGWTSYFRLAEETGLFERIGKGTRKRLRELLGEEWEKDFSVENLKETWMKYRKSVVSRKCQIENTQEIPKDSIDPGRENSLRERERRNTEASVNKEGGREMRERTPKGEGSRVSGRNPEIPAELPERERRHTQAEEEIPDWDLRKRKYYARPGRDNQEKGIEDAGRKNALAAEGNLRVQQRQAKGRTYPAGNEPRQAAAVVRRPDDLGVARWAGGGAVTPPDYLSVGLGVMELNDAVGKYANSGIVNAGYRCDRFAGLNATH